MKMSNISNLLKKEVKHIQDNFSADTSLLFQPRRLKTVEACIVQYNSAEEVSAIAKTVIKDRMQGDALLQAKKLCYEGSDEDYNSKNPKTTSKSWEKWINVLHTIGSIKEDGKINRNVSHLLDFAGYKERGGEIEIASHYREAKKITGATNAEPEKIDKAYEDAGGSELKTAADVKTAMIETQEINPYELFYAQQPEYKTEKPTIAPMAIGSLVIEKLPKISKKQWKKTYRTIATCVHPDKGGSDEDMSAMASFNEIMEMLFTNQEKKDFNETRKKAYMKFCAENDFKYQGI